jgi:hypothetical protein
LENFSFSIAAVEMVISECVQIADCIQSVKLVGGQV